MGELSAEFVGTMFILLFGAGSVAMAVVGLPESGRGMPIGPDAGYGNWLLITWGWGMGVMLGVYAAGGISTAHLNPAVTLANAVSRGFPWGKVLPYSVAQTLGAFTGAAVVFFVFRGAIAAADPDLEKTFGIFHTFPAAWYGEHGSYFGMVMSEFVGTAILVGAIFAIVDERNMAPLANVAPLIIGLLVFAIGVSFGAPTGYAINPARDFGPRVFAFIAGYGEASIPGKVDGVASFYLWVPIIGPLLGGVFGGVLYDKLLGDVLHQRGEPGDAEPGSAGEDERRRPDQY